MSVDVVQRNAPRLLESASEFMQHHTSWGKRIFSMIHPDVQEGVYYTMWQMDDSPMIPQYGTNRFEDMNGFSSPPLYKAEAIYQYLQSNGIQVPASMELIEQNVPNLRLAFSEYRRGYIRYGNNKFSHVHPAVKDGVYYTMWQLSNCPNIPNYGRDRFCDTNGQFSSPREKAQAIDLYLSSKRIPTVVPQYGENTVDKRDSSDSDSEDEEWVRDPIFGHFVSRPTTEAMGRGIGKGVQYVVTECEKCPCEQRACWTLFFGASFAGAAGLLKITQLAIRIFRLS